MEAGVGIEPAYTDLQSAAWPLCHPALSEDKGSNQKGKRAGFPFVLNSGAGEESRTLDLNLGKVALYQLSYARARSGEL
jgi:hypothetical protein